MVRRQAGGVGRKGQEPLGRSPNPVPPLCLPLPLATIALLAKDGHLVNLSPGLDGGNSQALVMGSSMLQERETYVLVQVISKWSPQMGRNIVGGWQLSGYSWILAASAWAGN